MAKHDMKMDAAEAAIFMDATFDRAELARAVNIAASVVEKRNTYPQLGAILIDVSPNGGDVSQRNLDFSLRVPLAKAKGIGTVMLPARSLSAFFQGATGETVTIKKPAELGSVTLSDSNGFTLTAVPYDTRPAPGDMSDKVKNDSPGFNLAEGVLKHLFALTEPFISNEETRYYLNGVCLQIEDDGNTLRAVATDGHRMGSRVTRLPARFMGQKPEPKTHTFAGYIVPAFAVRFINKHMAAGEVEVLITETHATFVGSGICYTTKLIEGTFPDWRRVVPDYAQASAVNLDTKDALRFLAAARALRTSRSSPSLEIIAEEGRPVFIANDPYGEGEMRSPINGALPNKIAKDAGGEMTPTKIGVNANYFAGALRVLGAAQTNVRVISDWNPFRIEAEGGDPADLIIIMPMRV